MELIKYEGDFTELTRLIFVKSSSDPFYEGTLQKSLGKDTYILIRQDRSVKTLCGCLIYNDTKIIKDYFDKAKIKYSIEIVED